MKLGVVILAAGQGTRMKSDLPKVLHTLAGRPLLQHVLDNAHALGAAQVVIVYGHGGEQVRTALADQSADWVEQARQLGTGHAVIQALPLLRDVDSVLVLYGDVPLTQKDTLDRLLTAAASTGLALLTVSLEDPSGYGRIVRDTAGQVQRIVEQKDASPEELAIREINTGILVADRDRLANWLGQVGTDNAQGEYYLTDIIALAVADGVEIATTEPVEVEEVMGINDRAQLALLERYFQQQTAHRLLLEGVTLLDPERFDLRGHLSVGRDVTIDVNVVLEGEVTLGDGVHIGPNVSIKDARIDAGTVILANSVIEQAVIGEGSRIGPFARIRPDTELAAGVHVGNFVEIKKSQVAAGSKINHLSYIGDTRMGSGVNIGAGTITCNYDGANKHQTIIGDKVFVGSNSALVAPVELGDGATIGAGSTINRNAPADQLTLSRARQSTVEGWRRPQKTKK